MGTLKADDKVRHIPSGALGVVVGRTKGTRTCTDVRFGAGGDVHMISDTALELAEPIAPTADTKCPKCRGLGYRRDDPEHSTYDCQLCDGFGFRDPQGVIDDQVAHEMVVVGELLIAQHDDGNPAIKFLQLQRGTQSPHDAFVTGDSLGNEAGIPGERREQCVTGAPDVNHEPSVHLTRGQDFRLVDLSWKRQGGQS